jgi:hypothetical protein
MNKTISKIMPFKALILPVFILILMPGCASAPAGRAMIAVPEGYEMRQVKLKDTDQTGVIFEQKFTSKPDILRQNAAWLNNRQTAEIAAGTTAAVAAYAMTDAYFKSKNQKTNPFIAMGATAGSAYAAAAIAGAVYDALVR